MWLKVLVSFVLLLNLAGCATAKKDIASEQVIQLKTQLDELETALKQKDEEIVYLETELQRMQMQSVLTEKKTSKSRGAALSFKDIQTALKNAGFYNGPIDGKIGRGTRSAIKAFQKDNNLTADGIVGEQTALRLKKYLN